MKIPCFDSEALKRYQAYISTAHHKMIDKVKMDDAALLTRSLKNITDKASLEALKSFFDRTTTK